MLLQLTNAQLLAIAYAFCFISAVNVVPNAFTWAKREPCPPIATAVELAIVLLAVAVFVNVQNGETARLLAAAIGLFNGALFLVAFLRAIFWPLHPKNEI